MFFNKFNLNEKIPNVDQCIDQAENAITETKNSSKIVPPIQSIQKFSHVEIFEISVSFFAKNLSKKSIIKEHHNDKSSKKSSQITISPKTKADKRFNEPQTVAPQQFLHVAISKRKREDADDIIEHKQKILKIMLTLLSENKNDDNDDVNVWTFTTQANFKNKFIDRFVISVSETYEKAIENFKWRKLWLETIQAELIALIVNGTWKNVVVFKNVNIVTSKWVFKTKIHIDDSFDKLKTRLMAKGFFQICETDYFDIFASTIKFDILRLFMIMMTLKNLKCHQIDVNNFFIESFLKKKFTWNHRLM